MRSIMLFRASWKYVNKTILLSFVHWLCSNKKWNDHTLQNICSVLSFLCTFCRLPTLRCAPLYRVPFYIEILIYSIIFLIYYIADIMMHWSVYWFAALSHGVVKNNPKRKRQLLRKAVGEPKTLLTVNSSKKQRRTETNPLKSRRPWRRPTQKRD